MSAQVPLYRRGNVIAAYALVDDDDFAAVSEGRWYLSSKGYAKRKLPRSGGPQREIAMHRFVLALTAGDPSEVDHINRDKLDNRRANLRMLPKGANAQNVRARSGLRGASYRADCGKWVAQVKVAGRNHHLGLFATEREAADAAAAFRAEHMPFSVEALAASRGV